MASNRIIEILSSENIPVLSEEGEHFSYETRRHLSLVGHDHRQVRIAVDVPPPWAVLALEDRQRRLLVVDRRLHFRQTKNT